MEPLTMINIGLVIVFLAFAFAAVNMFRGGTGRSGFDGLIAGHLGAMVFMALGGLIFIIGLIRLVINLVG